jgi:hypothetical protein
MKKVELRDTGGTWQANNMKKINYMERFCNISERKKVLLIFIPIMLFSFIRPSVIIGLPPGLLNNILSWILSSVASFFVISISLMFGIALIGALLEALFEILYKLSFLGRYGLSKLSNDQDKIVQMNMERAGPLIFNRMEEMVNRLEDMAGLNLIDGNRKHILDDRQYNELINYAQGKRLKIFHPLSPDPNALSEKDFYFVLEAIQSQLALESSNIRKLLKQYNPRS